VIEGREIFAVGRDGRRRRGEALPQNDYYDEPNRHTCRAVVGLWHDDAGTRLRGGISTSSPPARLGSLVQSRSDSVAPRPTDRKAVADVRIDRPRPRVRGSKGRRQSPRTTVRASSFTSSESIAIDVNTKKSPRATHRSGYAETP